MQSARSYRRPPLDETALDRARRRAKHVIVLMLENRSFDHLFGLLDHPSDRFPRLEAGGHPNPFDLADPSQTATVTAGGEPRLEVGPPHTHVAAMTQLDLRGTDFRMDGFVAAYAQKIAGKDDVARARWGRLAILAVVFAVPLAAAAHDLARRAVDGGWRGFPLWLAGAGVVVAACMLALQLHVLRSIRRYLAAGWAGATLFGAFAAAGITHWVDTPRGRIAWPLVTVALLLLGLWFAKRALTKRLAVPEDNVRELSQRIMGCMPPERIPALAQLARDYVVCTRWHSSVPGATWPNRNFVHAATSDESVDIELGFYRDRTIFELLDREDTASPRPTWRIYHHDTPQVIAFDRLWKNGRWRRWFDAGQLLDDIRAGTLPNYSFVEPCHTGTKANSQHPENNETIVSDDFERGDQLVASIYNALVANDDLFRQTVLVVTYDEHGGFFDHVPPPRAVHPDAPGNRRRSREISRRLVSKFVEYGNRPFPFTHLGVRVPAVVVSPWVQDHTVDDTVYDHASIVASLRRLFAPTAEPLSRRDRHANDFLHLLAAREDNDEPMTPAPCTTYNDTPGALAAAIGTDPADLEVDAAARGEPAAQVLLKDDFAAQLDQLNHLVRSELTTAAGDDVLPTAAGEDPVPTAADDEALPTAPLDDPLAATGEAEPVPTAALFKAGADSTRNGNPSLDDF